MEESRSGCAERPEDEDERVWHGILPLAGAGQSAVAGGGQHAGSSWRKLVGTLALLEPGRSGCPAALVVFALPRKTKVKP